MIIKSPGKHLTDQQFFTHIKFFDFVIDKKQIDDDEDKLTFKLSDIRIGTEEWGTIFNRIFMSGQVLDVAVEVGKGYKFEEAMENARTAANLLTKDKEKTLKILKNIEEGKKIKLVDVGLVSWVWYEVYEHLMFTPSEYKVPKEIEKMFRMEMSKYLDNFINDKLSITKKNYYKFETQKQALITLIEENKKIALYGNNFILREKIDSKCILDKLHDFCIIHTVYALQKLGYLKVVNIWEERIYKQGDHFGSTQFVNINLVLEDAFITEINNKYKKDNPKNILDKFDAKKGLLKFAGHEIELSKKGKETDAVLLLKTLMKAKGDEWIHHDEVLTDWGYTDADQEKIPKNKVYFAGQKINTAVALKVQIEDFVECNTSKARINPKYRKVDE